MFNQKTSPKKINAQTKIAKTNNMDLPKGPIKYRLFLDPPPITWSKTNLEMDKKLERTSSLENPNHIVGCHAFH
jgi:hypothetical protein